MMKDVIYLDLYGNDFIGTLGPFFADLQATIINLSGNELSGTIPNMTSDKLPNLVMLKIQDNNFTGSVPEGICNLKSGNLMYLSADCQIDPNSGTREI